MPPFTVASLATITHSRPSTTPIPVTIPATAPRRRTPPGRERRQLEKRRPGIDEPVDPLARGQLAARAVPLDRGATPPRATSPCARAARRRAPRFARAARELGRPRVDVGGELVIGRDRIPQAAAPGSSAASRSRAGGRTSSGPRTALPAVSSRRGRSSMSAWLQSPWVWQRQARVELVVVGAGQALVVADHVRELDVESLHQPERQRERRVQLRAGCRGSAASLVPTCSIPIAVQFSPTVWRHMIVQRDELVDRAVGVDRRSGRSRRAARAARIGRVGGEGVPGRRERRRSPCSARRSRAGARAARCRSRSGAWRRRPSPRLPRGRTGSASRRSRAAERVSPRP